MFLTSMMKFILGELVITPAALQAVPAEEIYRGIDRHVCGDWGEVSDADSVENEFALQHGLRLLSVYEMKNGGRFWVLTKGDRTATTVLLPGDY
jgi:hypothetical protein